MPFASKSSSGEEEFDHLSHDYGRRQPLSLRDGPMHFDGRDGQQSHSASYELSQDSLLQEKPTDIALRAPSISRRSPSLGQGPYRATASPSKAGTTKSPFGTLAPPDPYFDDELVNMVASDIRPLSLNHHHITTTTTTQAADTALTHTTLNLPSGSHAFAPFDPAAYPPPPSTQQKRRGRPVGWRRGMGPYSARASFPGGPSVPSKPPPSTGATRGRGSRGRRGRGYLLPRTIYERLRPRYVAFLCEWAGCPAELQNLATLRRHVLAVHGAAGEEGRCRWARCEERTTAAGGRAAFEAHVERAHLQPLAWRAGDGPRNTSAEAEERSREGEGDGKGEREGLPGYLFDAEGKQVTPSVVHQGLESEEEKKVRRWRLHRIIRQTNQNAWTEDEDESSVG